MMRKRNLKVLLVAGRRDDVALVKRALRKGPDMAVRVSDVPTIEAAIRHLESKDVDLVLLDLTVGGSHGADLVRQVRHIAPRIPIVVIADDGDETLAIKALQRDAQDYLLRHQLNPGSVARAVRFALEPGRWQDQYRRQLSISPDGILIVDGSGRIMFVNATAVSLLGEAPARVSDLPASMRQQSPTPVDTILETGRVAEIRDVETKWSGRPARLIMMRDTTERLVVERTLDNMARELQRANERLERLVGTDPLTNVLNRRGVEDILGIELRRMRRTGDGMTAVLIDCDDFKSVNDSFGHSVGDAVLAALTRSVQETVRVGDHVGRVGGDEFLVLLPGTSFAEGVIVAEKIRQAIKATALPVEAEGVRLSASLAVGTVGQDVISLEEVMASVQHGLKRSKELGKDTVSGDPGDGARSDGTSTRRARVTLDPTAIELGVVFQELRRLDTGDVMGYEALTRGPEGFFERPADLFRAAFEQNVLTTVDLRAFRSALARIDCVPGEGWYHVNLFPSTLLNTPAEHIVALLRATSAGARVCLELSEQQFLGDPAYLRTRIGEIRKAGFRIAIDDVGFGRSSVEALMLLEPDVVKVDRRCIRSIDTDAGDRRQLERLLAMLGAVDATVIVEGVETAEELEVLRDMGVPYAQGFLWGEPGPTPAEQGSEQGAGVV